MTDNTNPWMQRIRRIHFVGIGGVGMSGIAEVLLNQGFSITGTDLKPNAMTHRLEALGAKITMGHHEDKVIGADVVVVSSIIKSTNPEVLHAKHLRIPVVERARMLAELMRFQQGIAIAGAHGKTTTTSLIASIFAEAKLDPTFIIGGKLNSVGSNAKLGRGRVLIAEADESDASFLLLHPMISVVTNIDADHLTTYGGDFQKLKEAYVQFLHNLPFYGVAVLCQECKAVQSILDRVARPTILYGFSETADVFAYNLQQEGLKTHFMLGRKGKKPLAITLNLAGEHNVLNALAAAAVALDYGIEDNAIVKALLEFKGVGRRIEPVGSLPFPKGEVLILDDYGHHPEEIRVTIEAVRKAFPKRRLVMVFQPHRFTRTAELFDDFCRVLAGVDALFMMEVYSAGEDPIAGADSAHLCRQMRQVGMLSPVLVKHEEEALTLLKSFLAPDDIVLVQGAGTIGQFGHTLLSFWQNA